MTAADDEWLAGDFVSAHDYRDQAALQRLNGHYQRSFTFDDLDAEIWRRVYAFRQRAFKSSKSYLQLSEARTLIAQDAGFGSWEALARALTTGASPVPPYAIDPQDNHVAPRRRLTDGEWDDLIAVMKERRIIISAPDATSRTPGSRVSSIFLC